MLAEVPVRPVCVWVPHASNSDADKLTVEPGGGAVLDRSSREPHRLLLLLLMSVALVLLATAVTAVASSDILADAGADVGSGVDEDEEEEEEEERQPAPRSPSIKNKFYPN